MLEERERQRDSQRKFIRNDTRIPAVPGRRLVRITVRLFVAIDVEDSPQTLIEKVTVASRGNTVLLQGGKAKTVAT